MTLFTSDVCFYSFMVATEPGKCKFLKKVSENLAKSGNTVEKANKSGNDFGSVLVLMVSIPKTDNVMYLTLSSP